MNMTVGKACPRCGGPTSALYDELHEVERDISAVKRLTGQED